MMLVRFAFGQAALQEGAFAIVADEFEGAAVLGRGFGPSIQAAQKIGSRGR